MGISESVRESSDQRSVVNILWTGGLDSTYRVLVLLDEGRMVQPHYLIDKARRSTRCEIRAMDEIRESVGRHSSILSGVLLPTIFSERSESTISPRIRAAYNEVLKEFYVGEQYMWLADYCERRGISGMEIGIEKNPIVLEAVNSSGYPYAELFGRFAFPILSVDKRTMKLWAEVKGLLPVLEQSWFCHTPTADGSPCGVCHPCEVSVQGGMSYRLPFKARARYLIRIVPRVRAFLKQFPRLYQILYSLKHH